MYNNLCKACLMNYKKFRFRVPVNECCQSFIVSKHNYL